MYVSVKISIYAKPVEPFKSMVTIRMGYAKSWYAVNLSCLCSKIILMEIPNNNMVNTKHSIPRERRKRIQSPNAKPIS